MRDNEVTLERVLADARAWEVANGVTIETIKPKRDRSRHKLWLPADAMDGFNAIRDAEQQLRNHLLEDCQSIRHLFDLPRITINNRLRETAKYWRADHGMLSDARAQVVSWQIARFIQARQRIPKPKQLPQFVRFSGREVLGLEWDVSSGFRLRISGFARWMKLKDRSTHPRIMPQAAINAVSVFLPRKPSKNRLPCVISFNLDCQPLPKHDWNGHLLDKYPARQVRMKAETRIEQVQELLDWGHNTQEIAEAMGLSERSVNRLRIQLAQQDINNEDPDITQ